MDDVVNRFARELADAIAAAVADNPQVEACREKARAAGFEMKVTLEAAGRFDVPSPFDLTVGLPGWLVTGADVSPDGSIVLVRTYQAVLAYERRPGEALASAFTRPQCQAPQAKEEQGEAVAFAADGGSYVTIGEGTAPGWRAGSASDFAGSAPPEAGACGASTARGGSG